MRLQVDTGAGATGNQFSASVSADPAGAFVVTWTTFLSTNNLGQEVYAQPFSSSGVSQPGSLIHVNTTTAGNQGESRVAMATGGDFIIAWANDDLSSNANRGNIEYKRYNADGSLRNNSGNVDLQANKAITGDNQAPDVAMDANGNATISWNTINESNGNDEGVFLRQFDSQGNPIEATDIQVGTITGISQDMTGVAVDSQGDVAAIYRQDTANKLDIYAEFFQNVAPPIANAQSVNVPHNSAGTGITLTGSDPNTPPHSLTYSIVANPTHGTLSGFNASTGAVTYKPNAGYYGPDSFTFKDNNGTADSNTASVSLTVAAATPTANAQSVSVAHNTATAVTLTGTDGDDNPALSLTFNHGNAAHGTLSGTGANLTYTPSAGFHGADSFTFTTSNGQNTSSTATVTLNVAVGTPTANAQSVNVAHDSAGTAITVTSTDDDTPALTQTFAFTQPSHGTVTVSGPAGSPTVTYKPTTGYHGSDSFTFTDSNGTNISAAATVTLNVAVGTPMANAQTVSTPENTALGIALTSTDDDAPPLTLTYTLVTGQGPTNGMISNFNPSTGTLTYTPNAGFHGSDTFEFTVGNGTNVSSPAVVTINTSAVAQAGITAVSADWGTSGTIALQTAADGLRLLPAGRNTDLPWYGIKKLEITLSQPETLSPSDVNVTGINVANYGPVTISGSGTNYTITFAQGITTADRVTVTIGNAGIATFTRRLDVLPGDVNDDGTVNAQDLVLVRNDFTALGAVYNVFDDVNGDGTIDINDYNLVGRFVGKKLPVMVLV